MPGKSLQLVLPLEQPDQQLALFGPADRHLRMLRQALGIHLSTQEEGLLVTGSAEAVDVAAKVINLMQKRLKRHGSLLPADVAQAIEEVSSARNTPPGAHAIEVYASSRPVVPRTLGQRDYVRAMLDHDLTFCLGPAGTGKTYLAVAVATMLLKRGMVKRIVLARPAVEAGERLGFLPGDLQAKVNPYLRPLFDALHDMMDFEYARRLVAADVIEIIPLAFMRGRTLNQAAVILDEAQNTTPAQMLMFMTRLGHDSRMIVTGDPTQVDLPDDCQSGLSDAVSRLKSVAGVAIIHLAQADIVRHKLVQSIVRAYE